MTRPLAANLLRNLFVLRFLKLKWEVTTMVEKVGLMKFAFPVFLVLILLSSRVFAADQSPIVVKKLIENHEYHMDGSYENTVHIEKSANTDAAARDMAQYSFSYSPQLEQASVLEAFTKKKSGEIIRVARSQIYEQPVASEGQAPIFSDFRQKTIVFPNVELGDEVVLTIARRSKKSSMFGNFSQSEVFDRRVVYEDVTVNITVPKNLFVNIDTVLVKRETRNIANKSVYSFTFKNPVALPVNSSILSAWNGEPRFVISTYKSYRDLAATYERLSLGKDSVGPKIETLAKEITAGETDRRKQAILLYNWVSRHIRYVAVYLGNGGYEPHSAENIARSGYGDCKDHVVILQALLRAMGIESHPALINLDSLYDLPTAPTFVVFNHVITYIPEFQIFTDSTTGTYPFGVLDYPEYGKKVVVVAGAHSGVMTLPNNPLAENESVLQTVSTLQADGRVNGSTHISAKGPLGIALRGSAMTIESEGKENVASTVLNNIGNSGEGTFDFASPHDHLSDPYEISGSFSLDPRARIVDGKSFSIPTGLRILPLVADGIFWPGVPRSDEVATGCFSAHQVEELRLSIPEGWEFARTPSDQNIESQYFNFHAIWKSNGREVSVKRELTVQSPETLCGGSVLKEFLETASKIRATYRDGIEVRKQTDSKNLN